MDAGKATIAGAIISVFGLFAIEPIKRWLDASPSADAAPPVGAVTCDPIPAVADSPPPKSWEGHVWVPPDFMLTAGKLEAISGHWERTRAGGANTYIHGHWETDTGRCVWIRGTFVAKN